MSQLYQLEIGCEEIPARFMPGILADLKTKTEAELKRLALRFDAVETQGTYRRLAMTIRGLDETIPASTQEVKGPPIRIAKNDNGAFTPAALGFAKKNQVTADDLIEKELNGDLYVFAVVKHPAQQVTDILASVIPSVVMALNQPVGMRWGNEQKTFIRPIHWVLSLFGSTTVSFDLFGISSGNKTYGHRFLSIPHPEQVNQTNGSEIIVEHATSYESMLSAHSVCLSQSARYDTIRTFVDENQGNSDQNKGLLSEVSYLVESPHPIVGTFDPAFLALPDDVLVQCMIKHQKYFPCYDQGKLQPSFICVADNVTSNNKETIKQNNQKVLKARLKDVEFFWHEDLKRPISTRVDDLKPVLFQEGLGSMYDKLARHQRIASYILERLNGHTFVTSIDPDKMASAIWLSKADLTTDMVGEHPSLQGKIGRVYAEKEGIDSDISQAIEDHYLPKFEGDTVPENPYSVLSALADKLDTIVACFTNNLIPTGSQDPWGIRRHVFGVYSLILQHKLPLNVSDLFSFCYSLFEQQQNKDELYKFVNQRIKSFMASRQYRHDVIDASMKYMMDAPSTGLDWAQDLQQASSDKLKAISEMVVRVKNLAKKAEQTTFSPDLFTHEAEHEGLKALERFSATASTLDSAALLEEADKLAPAYNRYFEHVMVMDDDLTIRHNRLGFVAATAEIFDRYFPDFEALVL